MDETLLLAKELKVGYIKRDMKKFNFKKSSDSFDVFKTLMNDEVDYRENFYMLCLSRANNLIGWYRVSVGGTDGTVVDPKVIFSIALNCTASAIILGHNHPSGNIKPSQQDIDLTTKLVGAGKLLSIAVLDHMIVTEDAYYSFADEGLM